VAAVGVLKAAARSGLRVREELSIVGFDDIPLAEFTMPSLTTVHQPIAKLGGLAVEQLLRLISQPEQPPGVTTIEP
jgi:DNA-binding LacI/PurR family transcriptional regulator